MLDFKGKRVSGSSLYEEKRAFSDSCIAIFEFSQIVVCIAYLYRSSISICGAAASSPIRPSPLPHSTSLPSKSHHYHCILVPLLVVQDGLVTQSPSNQTRRKQCCNIEARRGAVQALELVVEFLHLVGWLQMQNGVKK